MSNYTTELHYLIEDEFDLGLKDYPIFDETYRALLNKKIIDHFYFREIAYETAGRFKFYLNRKLNEVMPYFNKMYQADLLKFNPITNKIVEEKTEQEGASTVQDTAKNITDGVVKATIVDTGLNTTDGKITGSIIDTGKNISDGKLTSTITDDGQNVLDGKVTNTEISGQTGSVDNTTTDHITALSTDIGDVKTTSKDHANIITDNTVKDTGSATGNTKTTVTRTPTLNHATSVDVSGNQIKSDTPQGILNTPDIWQKSFASEASFDKNSETRTVTETGSEKTATTVDTLSDTNNTTTTKLTTSDLRDITGTELSDHTITANTDSNGESATKTKNDINSNSDQSTKNTVQIVNSRDVKENNLVTDTLSNVSESTETEIKSLNTSNNQTKDESNVVTMTQDTARHTSDRDLVKRIISGYEGTSPTALLMELRSSFLNIDMLVISALEPCFFQLW